MNLAPHYSIVTTQENKDNENWKTTIFDKQPSRDLDKKELITEDKTNTLGALGEKTSGEFSAQRFDELEGYFNQANLTYRRKEDFVKFNVSKCAFVLN